MDFRVHFLLIIRLPIFLSHAKLMSERVKCTFELQKNSRKSLPTDREQSRLTDCRSLSVRFSPSMWVGYHGLLVLFFNPFFFATLTRSVSKFAVCTFELLQCCWRVHEYKYRIVTGFRHLHINSLLSITEVKLISTQAGSVWKRWRFYICLASSPSTVMLTDCRRTFTANVNQLLNLPNIFLKLSVHYD